MDDSEIVKLVDSRMSIVNAIKKLKDNGINHNKAIITVLQVKYGLVKGIEESAQKLSDVTGTVTFINDPKILDRPEGVQVG